MGDVRQAKLYYLRDLSGKAARNQRKGIRVPLYGKGSHWAAFFKTMNKNALQSKIVSRYISAFIEGLWLEQGLSENPTGQSDLESFVVWLLKRGPGGVAVDLCLRGHPNQLSRNIWLFDYREDLRQALHPGV